MSHSRILKMCVTGESLGKISQRVVRVTFFIVFSPYDQEKYMKERGGGGTYFFCVWRDMQQTTENMFFQKFKSLGYILHEHM